MNKLNDHSLFYIIIIIYSLKYCHNFVIIFHYKDNSDIYVMERILICHRI
jgi:hypothetical protein